MTLVDSVVYGRQKLGVPKPRFRIFFPPWKRRREDILITNVDFLTKLSVAKKIIVPAKHLSQTEGPFFFEKGGNLLTVGVTLLQ